MILEGAGPYIKLFLNQEAVGSFQYDEGAFELEGTPGKIIGITGNILVKVNID